MFQKKRSSAAGDTRSVHFLRFPDVKDEYFDETIERQVKRMQTVIELTRTIRERHGLSLKVRPGRRLPRATAR